MIRRGDPVREALLDTDILSEVLKARDQNVVARARAYEATFGKLVISVVTLMEVVKGYQRLDRKRELDAFLARLSTFGVLPFDHDEAEVAGRIYGDLERLGRPIGRMDPMIAAIAIVQRRVLITGNTVHYQNIVDTGYNLELDNWRGAGP